MDLFEIQLNTELASSSPLADRMRPRNIDGYFGQEHLIGKDKVLRKVLDLDEVPSMIFWGPPGTGKTTLARIIASQTKSRFVPFSAVSGNVKQVREIIAQAKDDRKLYRHKTILFVDEIHRFNKAQQDAFLPAVEQGIITLIGATTENPSFEINSALLSRCRVFTLESLSVLELVQILNAALQDKQSGLGQQKISIEDETLTYLATMANGDARIALNALELAVQAGTNKKGVVVVDKKIIEDSLQRSSILYDRNGEEHYNIISALHKSIRGSDANASLYWLGRMLEGGEDPLYVARRLVRISAEDIGLADTNALTQAVAAYQACHFIGMPECGVILAQCTAYLANAPKSIAVYKAYKQVQADIQELPNAPVPLHIRNAPTKLMKKMGYGKGYKYTPSFSNKEEAHQDYLPDVLKGRKYL